MPSPASMVKLMKALGVKLDDIPVNDRLIVQHNVRADKLAAADKLGGLPVPSLAVSKAGSPLQNFGEITLVGKPDMAVPSAKNPVYRSDAFTSRRPETETHYLGKPDAQKIAEIFKVDPIKAEKISYDLGDPERLRYNDIIENEYLASIGRMPNRANYKNNSDYFSALGKEVEANRAGINNYVDRSVEKLNSIGVFPQEFIYKGLDKQANPIYEPATLENIVKEMLGGANSKQFGEEGMSFNVANMRAMAQPKFNSLIEIQQSRNQIVPSAEFSPIANSLTEEFDKVYGLLSQDRRHYAEDALEAMTRSQNAGLLKSLYPNIKPETYSAAEQLLNRLSDPRLPTEYFEVKPQRAVGLNEFAGAIVPESASGKTLDILRRGGINDLQFYRDRDEADRIAKFMRFPTQMFSAAPAAPGLLALPTDEE